MRMQIRIITLDGSSPLTSQMSRLFPDADVGIQSGIDVRQSPLDALWSSELITHSVMHTLTHGRRWHHEVPSLGAVGLAQANRLALEEDVTQPLLLLESDCYLLDPERLRREVAHLLLHTDKFDMAVFGAMYRGKKSPQNEEWLPDGFQRVRDKFWLLHCVLYSPSGRRRVGSLLRKPLEMQIDSLYGSEAFVGNLSVVAQLRNPTAKQTLHLSTIQESVPPQVYMVGTLVVIAALVLWCGWRIRKVVRTMSPHIVPTRAGRD